MMPRSSAKHSRMFTQGQTSGSRGSALEPVFGDIGATAELAIVPTASRPKQESAAVGVHVSEAVVSAWRLPYRRES